jgi:branched-chain amino acid transport system ATP-binding protein
VIRVDHPTRARVSVAPGAPLLVVEGVRVAYGGIQALRGVGLEVHAGEIVALLGANGAGKTTTLKAITGLVPLSGGSIALGGRDISRRSPEERVHLGVSLVPEGRAIFPNLSVHENLELGAFSHKDRHAIGESLEDVVGLFPRLGERMRQAGGTLSGGEQQMLAIARALMARPSLLLLDEPSLGLAPKVSRQILDAVREIASSGVTVLLVEERSGAALELSRRAYVLRTGEVALKGASDELAKSPALRGAYLA